MTHTSTEQPEALYFADVLENFYSGISRCDATGAAAVLRRLHARNLELEAAQAQRVPLDAYSLRAIFKKLNANHDEEGWNFGDLVREVEAYHNITQEKQG